MRPQAPAGPGQQVAGGVICCLSGADKAASLRSGHGDFKVLQMQAACFSLMGSAGGSPPLRQQLGLSRAAGPVLVELTAYLTQL